MSTFFRDLSFISGQRSPIADSSRGKAHSNILGANGFQLKELSLAISPHLHQQTQYKLPLSS
jgi:hypothetical protein